MTRLFSLLAVFSVACTAPVFSGADQSQRRVASRIEGTVVVQSHARGNVIVTLHPVMPGPTLMGPAASFTLVSAESLFGPSLRDGTLEGPFAGTFTFSAVPPGTYRVAAFLDRDACLTAPGPTCRPSDFIPWFQVTNEPNRGDVGGIAVGEHTVAVDADGFAQPVTGVRVAIGDVATFGVDRPVFSVTGTPAFDPTAGPKPLTLTLRPLDEGVVHQDQPAFLVRWVDLDGDSIPDDTDADGQPDLWPRLLVRKLSDAPGAVLTDENDLDRDGVLDEEGVDHRHLGGTLDGRPDAVVLAAAYLPPPSVLSALTGPGGPDVTAVVPVTSLDIALLPLALDLSNPEAPAPLEAVPSGTYRITVVNFTGQTWRVPNESTPGIGGALGLPQDPSQAFRLQVP